VLDSGFLLGLKTSLNRSNVASLTKGKQMELVVEIRNVYGVEQVYPVCNKAKLFASIAGTKTLTHKVMIDIASLGYLVTLKQPTLNQQLLQQMQAS
jgi:hypothetical protein